MGRGRIALALLLSTAAVGGIAAVATRTPEAGRFTLPAEVALLPPQSSFVAGVDVQRLVASPAYQRFRRESPPGVDMWAEIEKRTGVRPERDVTSVVMASDSTGSGLTVVLGRFERGKVEAALGAMSGIAAREHGQRKIWASSAQAGGKEHAVAVVDDGLLLMGSTREVEAGLERRDTKAPGLIGNAPLLTLTARVEPGATFWMCGDQGGMAAAGNLAPQAAGWTLPQVKTFVVSGDIDPELRATLVAETADETAAKSVADMVRTVMGLVAMQGAQRPELRELTSGIQVTQQGAEVRIAARIAHDTLAKLQARPRPTPRPSAPAESQPPARPAVKK